MGDYPTRLRGFSSPPRSPVKKRFSQEQLLPLRSRSNSTRSNLQYSCGPSRSFHASRSTAHDTVMGRPGPGAITDIPPPRPPLRNPRDLLQRIAAYGADVEASLDVDAVVVMKNEDSCSLSARTRLYTHGRPSLPPEEDNRRVFGVSLQESIHYAACPAALGGYLHDLPIIAFAATEELYRTGLYKDGLFVDLPNRDRHLQLITIFDQPQTDFGRDVELHTQRTPDVCALLTSYITLLPEPLFHPLLVDALWTWCVEPSIKRDAEQHQRDLADETGAANRRQRHYSTQTFPQDLWQRSHRPSSSYGSPVDEEDPLDALEAPQISIAQLLLRLLPSASYSFLVYLCAFFSQVMQYRENGMQSTDIARLFAQKLVGGDKEKAKQTLVWMLTRWSRIAAELMADALEAREKAEMEAGTAGPTPRPVFRPVSIKTVSESTTTSSSSSSVSGYVSSPSSSTFAADQISASPASRRKRGFTSPTDGIFNMDTFAWDGGDRKSSVAEIDVEGDIDLSEALERIVLLENEGKEGASANQALQRDLEIAQAERDEARELVGRLKKMILSGSEE